MEDGESIVHKPVAVKELVWPGSPPLVLISAAAVAGELGLGLVPDHGALSALLAPLGVHVAGLDESGGPLWRQGKVQAARADAQREWGKVQSMEALAPVLEPLRDVLAEQAGAVLQRALERHLSPALNDLDDRLDKFGAGLQALNRQSGGHGDLLRDVAGRHAEAYSGIRSAQDAQRKDMAARLQAVERACQVGLEGLLDEVRALRLSINELSKRVAQ